MNLSVDTYHLATWSKYKSIKLKNIILWQNFVASSWRNLFQQDVDAFLRNEGHEAYDFTHLNGDMSYRLLWSIIDPNLKNCKTQQYRNALNQPIAQKGFDLYFNAMRWTDVCVLVLPCGRSANTEAGWMKGAGKRVMGLFSKRAGT